MNLKNIGRWALARAKEKSTWTGLAVIAGALGAGKVGVHLDQLGQIIGVLTGSVLTLVNTTGRETGPVTG